MQFDGQIFSIVGALESFPRRIAAREIARRDGLLRRGLSRHVDHAVFGGGMVRHWSTDRIDQMIRQAARHNSRMLSENGFLRGLGILGEPSGGRFRWAPVDGLRSLPFDHAQILRTAVERVRSKTLYSSLPVHLMPAQFTLGELQRTYEQVLGAVLDKRGFRRRIEELDVIEEIPGAFTSGGSHRPAQLYRKKAHAPALKTAPSNLLVS